MAVAGRRSRRSRSPIRHASSSPRRTWPMPMIKRNAVMATCHRLTQAEHCCGRTVALSQCPGREFGGDGPTGLGVASNNQPGIVCSRFVAWRIYASADKAVYRRNQAIAKAQIDRPQNLDLGQAGPDTRTGNADGQRTKRGVGRWRRQRPTLISRPRLSHRLHQAADRAGS